MRQSAYETVIQEIEGQIARGELRAGDRLEGERQLAERLGVSRTSAREALRVLTVLGVVSSAPGSGPLAGAHLVVRPELPLTSALQIHMAAASFSVPDVVDARIMIESWAYRQAGSLPIPETVRVLLERMDSTEDPHEFLALDSLLHVQLVGVAGNPLLSALMSALRGATERYTSAGVARIDDWAATKSALQVDHRGLVSRLEASEGDAAADLAVTHITRYAALAGLIPD